MKKVIFSAVLLAGLGKVAYAGGTIAFQNYTYGTVLGEVYSNNVATPWIGPINLELFYGPVGDTLPQLLDLNTSVVFPTTIPPGAAGRFVDGNTVITSGPLGGGSSDATLNIELAVAGWTGDAANYLAALADPVDNPYAGITAAFGNPTGGGGAPQATPANMVEWTFANSLIVTPEPATIVLGGLGAAAFLLFRLRK